MDKQCVKINIVYCLLIAIYYFCNKSKFCGIFRCLCKDA